MDPGGAGRDVEPFGELGVGETLRHQGQDLPLPGGELDGPVGRFPAPPWSGRWAMLESPSRSDRASGMANGGSGLSSGTPREPGRSVRSVLIEM